MPTASITGRVDGIKDESSSGSTSQNSVYAALARSLGRGVALYMSRPVRLFRPTKREFKFVLDHFLS